MEGKYTFFNAIGLQSIENWNKPKNYNSNKYNKKKLSNKTQRKRENKISSDPALRVTSI